MFTNLQKYYQQTVLKVSKIKSAYYVAEWHLTRYIIVYIKLAIFDPYKLENSNLLLLLVEMEQFSMIYIVRQFILQQKITFYKPIVFC